jgi:hypothetical protein
MSLGTATVTTITNILKTRYPQKKLFEMNYEDCAFLGTVKKDTKFGGNNTRITVPFGRTQGSINFATALANQTADDDAAFLVTRTRDYHVITMSAEAIEASEGDGQSLMKAFDKAHKNGILSFKRSTSQQLYRNGGGARGRISAGSTVSTNTITLAEPADAVIFEVNMFIQTATTDGLSGAAKAGQERIAAINRNTGTITSASAAWDTVITTIAVNDYLFRAGDFGAAMRGLDAWLPATDPAPGDNFFGVDRSQDSVRLAGVRYTGTAGAAKEDTLVDCATRLGREGGKPTHIFCNNLDRADIIKNQGSHAVYDKVNATEASIHYKALILQGDRGELAVLADPNCPRGIFYMAQLDTFTLGSLKAVPHVVEDDGRMLMRQANADGVEWRLRAFSQLYCEAPGFNARGTF